MLLGLRIRALGWGLPECLVAAAISVTVVVLAANYPLMAMFDGDGATIRSILRSRRVRWDDVVAIRRTGRRGSPTGHRRPRGGLLLVTGKGTVLACDARMSPDVVDRLASLLQGVSAALADSLRSEAPIGR